MSDPLSEQQAAALSAHRAAVLRAPQDPALRLALGVQLRRMGRLEDAAAVLRATIALAPGLAAAHHQLGSVLRLIGQQAEAEVALRKAVSLHDPRVGAIAANDLGSLLGQQGRATEAVAFFREAIQRDPRFVDAYSNLCAALSAMGQHKDAMEAGSTAVRLRPEHANAQANLGAALAQLGRHEHAASACRTAIRLRPGHANAHANLGLALRGLGRFAEAEDALRQAIRLEPSHRNASTGLAMTLLLQGRLSEGFAAYEDRLSPRPASIPGPPPWRGEALDGRAILLHAEQGIGDTIQFIRYLPALRQRGAGRVLLAAPPLFRRLLAELPGLDALLQPGQPAARADVHCPLMSLPHAFGTTLETIPAPVPYLRTEPAALLRWGDRLQALRGLRVGLAWAGNPQHQNDRNRSIGLAALAPFWDVPGVRWVSLQIGTRAAELVSDAPSGALLDVASELTDLAETAAAMERLDLIVTVDTAVAHLAGALGRPVWVMLPALPDWRWLLGREDSPWYPTMRLFRQPRLGDWGGVVASVAAALQACVRQRSGPAPL